MTNWGVRYLLCPLPGQLRDIGRERYNEAIACGRKAMQQRFGLTNGHRIYIMGPER
jgi:hypothetical protein